MKRLRLRNFFLLAIIAAICSGSAERETKSQPFVKQRVVPNQPVTTIPVEIPSYALIFLKAQINSSSSFAFVLDSGASFPFVISTSRAQALGLNLQHEIEGYGGAGEGSYRIRFTSNLSIGLPGLMLQRQTAAVISMNSIESLAGRPIDGLVGSKLFNRFVVEIDYVGHTVKLYDPKSYNYVGQGETLPLMIQNYYLFVTMTLALPSRKDISGKFLIDTGGGMVAAVATTPFVESRNLVSTVGKTIRDDSLSALGGELKLLVSRPLAVKLGKLVIRQPIVYLSQNRSGALASTSFDGVIGGELLNRFRVIFDYSRQRLILEPNAYFERPFGYNMTGISLRATGERFKTFTVYQVMKDSPASEAGVQRGDVILKINGRSAAEFTADDLYRMFKENVGVLRLVLSRGTKTVLTEMKPRPMI